MNVFALCKPLTAEEREAKKIDAFFKAREPAVQEDTPPEKRCDRLFFLQKLIVFLTDITFIF